MASTEIESFRIRFAYEFDRLLETIADLDDDAVNWRPPVPGANSLLVLVTHAIASAEDHVVGKAAGKTVVRNRDAVGHLFTTPGKLLRPTLVEGRLDEVREPPLGKWPASRGTVRDRLVHSVSHTAEHVGHAQLTRDLLKTRAAG